MALYRSKLREFLLGLTDQERKAVPPELLEKRLLNAGIKPDEIKASKLDEIVANKAPGEKLTQSDVEEIGRDLEIDLDFGPAFQEYGGHKHTNISTAQGLPDHDRFTNVLNYDGAKREMPDDRLLEDFHYPYDSSQVGHTRGYVRNDLFGTTNRPARILEEVQSDPHQHGKLDGLPFRKNWFDKLVEREMGEAFEKDQELAMILGGDEAIKPLARADSIQNKYYGDKAAKRLEKIAKRQGASYRREQIEIPSRFDYRSEDEFDAKRVESLLKVAMDTGDPDGNWLKAAKRAAGNPKPGSGAEKLFENFEMRLNMFPESMSEATPTAFRYDLRELVGPETVPADMGIITNRPGKTKRDFNLYNMAPLGISTLGGIAALTASDESHSAFLNKNALNANLDKLKEAEGLKESGSYMDEIWKKTGWFEDEAGDWKWELDDSSTKVDGSKLRELMKDGESHHAASVVDSPVFDEYPFLKENVRIRMTPNLSPGSASYNQATKTISLSDGEGGKDLAKSFGHEFQHAIQGYQNMAAGGNSKQFSTIWPTRSEVDLTAMDKVAKEAKDLYGKHFDVRDLATADDGPGIMRVLYNAMLVAEDKTGLKLPKETREALINERSRILRAGESGFSQYKRLAGEIEARNVENRMFMDPEERAKYSPWFTEDGYDESKGKIIRRKNPNEGMLKHALKPIPKNPNAKYGGRPLDTITAEEYPAYDSVGRFISSIDTPIGKPFEGLGELFTEYGKPRSGKQSAGTMLRAFSDVFPGWSALPAGLTGELMRDQ